MQTNLKIDELESTQKLKIGEYRLMKTAPIKTEIMGLTQSQSIKGASEVDAESALFGMNRPLSRNIVPMETNMNIGKIEETVQHIVPSEVINIGENTRVAKSCSVYDNYSNFQYLPDDVQNVNNIIFRESRRGGENARNVHLR